jgi:hypothetical protein
MKKIINQINVKGLALILLVAGFAATQSAFKTAAPYENYGQYTGTTIPGVAIKGQWYQEGSNPAPGYMFSCHYLEDKQCTFDFEQDPNSDPSDGILKQNDGEFKLVTTP